MRTRQLAILAALLAAPAQHASAQTPGYLTNSNTTGMPEYGSFISSQIDRVNLANGGLSLNIPIVSRKGRGVDYSLVYKYESKFWVVDRYVVDVYPSPVIRFHWRPDLNSTPWVLTNGTQGMVDWLEQDYTCAPYPTDQYPPVQLRIRSNWTYTAPDGTKYQFPLRKIHTLSQYPGTSCIDEIFFSPQLYVGHSDNGHIELDISSTQAYPIGP